MLISNGDIRIDAYVEASSGKRVSRITHLVSGAVIMWEGRIGMKAAKAEMERMLARDAQHPIETHHEE